jgi:hypothetical protein
MSIVVGEILALDQKLLVGFGTRSILVPEARLRAVLVSKGRGIRCSTVIARCPSLQPLEKGREIGVEIDAARSARCIDGDGFGSGRVSSPLLSRMPA